MRKSYRRARMAAVLFLLLASCSCAYAGGKGTFEVRGQQFLLNGKPFRVFSGEIHYPRVPREYWKDRLLKARAMGLNTVCTYLFWNWHEPEPGEFTFDGNLDVAAFIRTAQEAGLKVIIRPGPYVCSEWDFGGLPAWLLREGEVRVRCMDPRYIAAVKQYVGRIGQELRGLQITRGGPIIMLQVENEYGSYGNDREYMEALRDLFRKAGFDVPFFTSDGGAAHLLESGGVTGATPVVNFGGDPKGQFAVLEQFRPGIPQMCGEYWCGWFTHWGNERWGGSKLADNVKELGWMLANGKSFNLYMFHGGTNFGWSAGANWDNGYKADITSYDYDAPLDEAGRVTEKYREFRTLLSRYQPSGETMPEPPVETALITIDQIQVNEAASLFSRLPPPIRSASVLSMEMFGQNHGYILYRTRLRGPKSGKLVIHELRDIGYVFLDGKPVGRLDRREGENSIDLPLTHAATPMLDILVEGMGRINFGSRLIDRKGITEWVTLRGVTLMQWEVYRLPLDSKYMSALRFSSGTAAIAPAFFRGEFTLQETGDTFLDMAQWKKGVVWVNGHNLGRYWNVGPQQRLYCPGPWLREGKNEVIIFDPEMTGPVTLRGLPELR